MKTEPTIVIPEDEILEKIFLGSAMNMYKKVERLWFCVGIRDVCYFL